MDQMAITTQTLRQSIGHQVGESRWHHVDQPMIDAFAGLTKDDQFIHVDPARAADTPFGGTIAHGFLTLSLLSVMAQEALPPLDGLRMSVNYGFDRIRFVAPVPVNSDLRAVLRLDALDSSVPGQVKLTWDVSVVVKGQDKPAIAATWIHLHFTQEP